MFFGTAIAGNKKHTTDSQLPIVLTRACVAPSQSSKPVNVFIESTGEEGEPKEPILICSLIPNSKHQCSLNLTFETGEPVTFRVEGDSKVYLSGFYVFEELEDFDDEELSDEELSDEESEEEEEPVTNGPGQKRPNAIVKAEPQPAKKQKVEVTSAVKEDKKPIIKQEDKKPAVQPKKFEEDEDDDESSGDENAEEDLEKLLAGVKKAKTNGAPVPDGDNEDDEDMDDEEDDDDEEEDSDDEAIKSQQNKLKDQIKKGGQQQQQKQTPQQQKFGGNQQKFGGQKGQTPQGQSGQKNFQGQKNFNQQGKNSPNQHQVNNKGGKFGNSPFNRGTGTPFAKNKPGKFNSGGKQQFSGKKN